MRTDYDKHEGKSTELLVLKEPAYVMGLLAQADAGSLDEFRREVGRLIELFDGKEFVRPCHGCRGRATRGSVYRGAAGLRLWCDQCDPHQLGAASGKLVVVRTYWDAITCAQAVCGGRASALKRLVIGLARAKG